jgi:hypothetical protein
VTTQPPHQDQTSQRWRLVPPKGFLFLFALGHSAISVWLFLRSFTLGMARLDSGASPTVTQNLTDRLSHILLSPLFMFVARSELGTALLPGLLGWLPLVANSALWAVATWWLLQLLKRLRNGRITATA